MKFHDVAPFLARLSFMLVRLVPLVRLALKAAMVRAERGGAPWFKGRVGAKKEQRTNDGRVAIRWRESDTPPGPSARRRVRLPPRGRGGGL